MPTSSPHINIRRSSSLQGEHESLQTVPHDARFHETSSDCTGAARRRSLVQTPTPPPF